MRVMNALEKESARAERKPVYANQNIPYSASRPKLQESAPKETVTSFFLHNGFSNN